MGYTDLVNQFIYKEPLVRTKFDALAENDAYLKDNGWQNGVKVIFYQASVPTGWTQDVSQNDKFLRVVNNLGGNPGGVAGGSVLVSTGIVLAHIHTFASQANHQHAAVTSHSHAFTSGQLAKYDTVFLSKSPRVFGIGDVEVTFNQNGTGSTGPGNWNASGAFDSGTLDNTASSNGGTHNHTVGPSMSTIFPAYTDVIIGIKSASSGYTDMTTFFNHNDKIRYEPFGLVGGLYGNDVYNRDRLMPVGSVSIFFMGSAPLGWNKLATQNDKALRIVSGAGGGAGGVLGTSQTIVLSHNHSNTSAGTHNHTTGNHRHNVLAATGIQARTLIQHPVMYYVAFDGSDEAHACNNDGTTQLAVKGRSNLTGSGLTMGDAGEHTHTISNSLTNIILAYVDVIQCQKLSTGAPYTFQDLSVTAQYKRLVSKQKLDKFAQNDGYLKYHTTPAGAIMAFYQSAIPLLWTLLSGQHDKVLRVVSGAGGLSGGSQNISNPITLFHTHPISNLSHSHSTPSHTHVFDTVSTSAGSFLGGLSSGHTTHVAVNARGADLALFPQNTNLLKKTSTGAGASSDSQSHNHGGATSSNLSNITFAYASVILCQKN